MNYIPIIVLGIVVHFIGAVITACIILKLEEGKPKPEYPDEEECIELISFAWELALIVFIIYAIIMSPCWIAKWMCNHKSHKNNLDDTKSYEHF